MRWHSVSNGATGEQHVHSLRHLRLAPELARRLRTAALGEDLYADTYTILVIWWPLLAPLPRLLHAPRRARDNRGTSWEQFAVRYRADLDALPLWLQNAYVLNLGKLLQRHPSVTLLSPEPCRGSPEGQAHTQRRVLWRWMVE